MSKFKVGDVVRSENYERLYYILIISGLINKNLFESECYSVYLFSTNKIVKNWWTPKECSNVKKIEISELWKG